MPHNKFTLRKVVEDFSLEIVEDSTFIPEVEAIAFWVFCCGCYGVRLN